MNNTEARVSMKLGKVNDDLWIVLDGKNQDAKIRVRNRCKNLDRHEWRSYS